MQTDAFAQFAHPWLLDRYWIVQIEIEWGTHGESWDKRYGDLVSLKRTSLDMYNLSLGERHLLPLWVVHTPRNKHSCPESESQVCDSCRDIERKACTAKCSKKFVIRSCLKELGDET